MRSVSIIYVFISLFSFICLNLSLVPFIMTKTQATTTALFRTEHIKTDTSTVRTEIQGASFFFFKMSVMIKFWAKILLIHDKKNTA